MRAGFYPHLAANGIKKNKKLYVPYILTCAGMIMMNYIISFLATSEQIANMGGGGTAQLMLAMGVWIIGVFSVIFLFYTNSFLMRRRKKELGLYNILGMNKKKYRTDIVMGDTYDSGNFHHDRAFRGYSLFKDGRAWTG